MFKILYLVFLLAFCRISDAEFYVDDVKNVISEKGVSKLTELMMLDATAKSTPNGMLKGNFYNLGSFDECLAIKDEAANIRGKYCYATCSIMAVLGYLNSMASSLEAMDRKKQLVISKIKPDLANYSTIMGFHFGVCVPDNVNADDLNKKVPLLSFGDDLCYTDERKLETKHWIALGVLGTIVVIVVLSTIYDVIIQFLQKEPINAIAAFSIYYNGKQLLKSTKNEEQLLCINGLRVLNMMWVIIGHVYANFLLTGAIDNWADAFKWMDGVGNMAIMGATVSVDSFFMMGGLLTVYIYMKLEDVDLETSVKSVPLMYLHRYLRLTPALAIMVMLYSTGLIQFLGDGPRWGQMQEDVSNCEQQWWSVLLYLQNYLTPTGAMCIDPSWYLSVDMQLFILSPLILIPLKKWPKYVLPVMVTLVGLGVAIPFWIGYSNKLTGIMLGSADVPFTTQYYFKTHARFGPYVIGMLTGYLIHKMRTGNRKLKMNVIMSTILWLLAIAVMIACVFDGYDLKDDQSNALYDGLYLGLNRSVWSLALALVIILCVSGNGGHINTFLSCPIMQFLSKLSYSMYLIHYLIITSVNSTRRDTMHFSNYEAIFQFFSFFSVTFIISVIYTLLFESPIMKLEKIIFSKTRT